MFDFMHVIDAREEPQWGTAIINRRLIVIICGVALTIATVVGVVSLRNRSRELPTPEVPVVASPAEVRVKAVGRMGETLDLSNVETAKFSNKRPRRAAPEFGILSPETA